MNIGYDKVCAFLVQILAQMHRDVAHALNGNRFAFQQIGAERFLRSSLDAAVYPQAVAGEGLPDEP